MPSFKTNHVIIALGSNVDTEFSTKMDLINSGLNGIDDRSVTIDKVAPLYESLALNPGQPNFLNTVAVISTALSPISLLRKVKQAEMSCGRRGYRMRWASRTLDIDIIDFKGLIQNWQRNRPVPVAHGHLNLPHGQAHKRSFVLLPLIDLMPKWRHPVLQVSGNQLSAQVNRENRQSGGQILRVC